MSGRTLLIAALALMAGGLLLGGIGVVFGDGATPVRSQPVFGPRGQHGTAGGIRPGRPGFGPGSGPAIGPRRPFPGTPSTPSPKPSPTA